MPAKVPSQAVRCSLSPFHRQEVPFLQPKGDATAYGLLDIPLYALCRLRQELS